MAIKRSPKGDAGLNENANNQNRTIEHLVELQGRQGSIKYRQMSRGDGNIGMILRVHKNPIRSASWNIPAPDDASDLELEAIDVISNVLLGECGTRFDKLLGQILSCLEYGFSCFEKYYKTYENDGKVYLVPVLEQRMQTSIENIFPQRNLVQQITIEKGLVDIALDEMVFFSLNQQGEDLRGESLLRTSYKSWKRKNIYEEWLGIGIQRSTSGIPSMTVPVGTTVDSPDYQAAEQLLQNITFHENAYMIIQKNWEFEIHESKFNSEQVQKAIDSANTEMSLSVLAQFILLGQNGGGGSYALSRDQSDFFLDGLMCVVNLITGTINEDVIKPFIKLNYGDAVDPARVVLKLTNLNKKAMLELSTILKNFKDSSFITPNVDDEIQLRKSLDMDELSEEEVAARREKQSSPAPQPSQTGNPNASQIPYKKPEDDQIEAARLRGMTVKLSETSRNKRQNQLSKNEKEMSDFMQANLLLIKDKMLADIESTLNRGSVQIQGLKKIEVSSGKYVLGLEKKLSGIAIESWNRAKGTAKAKAIKFAEDANINEIPDVVLKQFVLNQAQSVADQQTANMLNRAILTASNSSLKGYSIAQTISNVSKVIDSYLESGGVNVSGSLIVVGTTNFGETQFYKEIEDQIWGYVFTNDDPISEICQFYDDKTFSVNSPELAAATPPLHPNCKSYLAPIYKSDVAEKPEINDVTAPPSLQGQKTIY